MTQAKKIKKPASKKAPLKVHQKKTHTFTPPSVRSFHITAHDQPFTSLQFTRQTLYWAIFVVTVLLSQLWILHLQLELNTLLDKQQAAMQEITYYAH